jgi:hypothetical protein
MRCVPDRLARDLWIKPDEKMVRLWRRTYAAEINFDNDYQPWVIANFSGILCVDEVYQGDLALLLAVDPAAPDGDRLVGYTLLPKTREVDQGMVKAFLDRLRAAGINPDEVITDDPVCTRRCWPSSGQQRCTSCACSTPRGAWSAPSVGWSNTSDARCRRHHGRVSRPCSAASVGRRRRPISMTQTRNRIGGAWPGERWASPTPMRCTNTSRPLGRLDANSASATARSASGSSSNHPILPPSPN